MAAIQACQFNVYVPEKPCVEAHEKKRSRYYTEQVRTTILMKIFFFSCDNIARRKCKKNKNEAEERERERETKKIIRLVVDIVVLTIYKMHDGPICDVCGYSSFSLGISPSFCPTRTFCPA
jgi:hypothetical protein